MKKSKNNFVYRVIVNGEEVAVEFTRESAVEVASKYDNAIILKDKR